MLTLDEHNAQKFEPEHVLKYAGVTCPKCASVLVYLDDFAVNTLAIPPVTKRTVKCELPGCGFRGTKVEH